MPHIFFKEKLGFLSLDYKDQLNRYFSEPGRKFMPHQLAAMLGVRYADAISILNVLSTHKLSENQLLIYHICDPEVPAGAIPYGDGFPNLPWSCPLCGKDVEDPDELSYDLLAKVPQAVTFE
jgi:hypothetical protein